MTLETRRAGPGPEPRTGSTTSATIETTNNGHHPAGSDFTGTPPDMAIAGVPVLTGELINGDRRRQSDTLLVRECPSCRAPHLFRNAGIKTAACGLSCVVVAE